MTIIRCEYEGVIYDLDVLEETPIRLDISAIENDAIGEVFGAASQQFTLPGSKKNNRFFKHAYKVGADNVPGLNESVKAWLISESDTLLEGSLYLDGVVKTKNEGVNYEVTIVNNIITFNELIKTTRVKDLSWSNYNHSLSMINITGSWNNDLFGGDIFYPLVDFGRDGSETTGSLPNVAWNPANDNTAGFINSTITPIKANQFSPAIRVKTLLDKIFQAGQFTYETSLTDLFEATYILPRQVETLGVKGSGFTDFGFIASKNTDQVLTGDAGYSKILNQVEVYDPTNGYNPSTSVYTIPSSGTYSFSGSIVYSADPEDPSPSILIRVRNTTDNVTIGGTVFNVNELTGSFGFETSPTYLAQNTTIELQGAYDQSGGEGQIDIFIESGSNFQTKETPLNWETGIVNVGEQFDPQLKCIDLLRGIIQKFNLVFEPDYTKNRVIKIETYDKWVLQGDKKDWSNKIQQAERIFLRSPLKDQPKTIQFEDAKDNDKLSKQVIDNAEGLQWGTAIVDAISDVPQGEKKVGEYFAPVILEQIPNAPQSTNVIPQLYKTDDTQVERKTFKHKPRIGYKVNSSFGAGNVAYIGNNITPFTDYATISNYNSIPIVPGTTKNLHWNDTFYTPTFSATTGSITAYDEYWNTYVNQLYNDGNKIIRADIYFEPYELRDINLNDVIFVEDQYYRINKISGFNVNYGDVVSVELISLAQGELPTVELNCNFNFVFGETTTTTTRIPPVQPTTSTTTSAPTTTTTSTTTLPPESVILNISNQFTEPINRSRVVFESNPDNLFQYKNIPALSNVSTSSLQTLVTGSGGTNDIYVSWRLSETGSEKDLKLYSYNATINIDGSFAGSKAGSYYTNVTQSIDELLYSNANIRTFDSYSVSLTFKPYTGTSYIRNFKLDYDNNTEFDVAYSRIKLSDNPDNLFKIYNITSGSNIISASNETIITPLSVNTLTSDFEFDYNGLIDFDFTASLSKDGSLFNILSGSAFLSQSNQYSVLLDGALDPTLNVSYSVDWEINNGTSTTYLYYTNVGLSGSFPNFQRVGNSRSNVCETSLISNDDFAFTTESLAVGVQLYNNPSFTENFQFVTRSESSLFANNNWIKVARPYSDPPYTGSSYRIDENGVIIDEWPCGYIWVPFIYNQTSNPPSDTLEFNFTTPYNEIYSGIGATSGSIIAEKRIQPYPPTYFVSLVDSETVWSSTYGNFNELIGSASNDNVFESKIMINPSSKLQSTLDGYIHSGSIDRLPTFKMISDLTGSSQNVSAFSKYLINDDSLTYLPDSSSLQVAHISPNDYFFSQINEFDRGQIPDFSGRKNTVGTLNYNTVYVARATVDSVTNSIYINNNASSDSNNRGNIYLDVNNQFNVKSMVIVYDKEATGTTGPSGYLFDFRDMTGTLNGDNNYGYLRANTIDTQSGSLWESGSYYVFDEASDTHTNVGETNVSNLIGTGSTQYPGPGGLTSNYTKRVFTFNFNPNRTFTANLFNSGGRMYIGSSYEQRGGMRGRIYGVFLYDRALTFEEHKSITNLMIDKGFISGSIV